MGGIVSYTGNRTATQVLLNELRRLDYGGDDSVRLSLIGDGCLRAWVCGLCKVVESTTVRGIAAAIDQLKDKTLNPAVLAVQSLSCRVARVCGCSIDQLRNLTNKVKVD